MSPGGRIDYNQLISLATACGLKVLGVISPDEFLEDGSRLKNWQDRGFASGMEYMKRSPKLLSSPRDIYSRAESIVMFAAYYSRAEQPERPAGYGRVARYAWGKDYHRQLKKRLKSFVELVGEKFSSAAEAKIFTDAVPFLERAAARRAGLGFIGKNTLLIRKGEGSFSFIGEVLWNVEVENLPRSENNKGSCGECTKCLSSCPTGALPEPFVLDANKCISYLTIEKRGSLEIWEREALGEWVFGCDICQEVCPFNHTALKERRDADWNEFDAKNGSGPLLDLQDVLTISGEEEYLKRFAGTPLMRAKREGLLRNAACVLANTHDFSAIGSLLRLSQDDKSEVVRQHALWAASKLERLERGSFRPALLTALESTRRSKSTRLKLEAESILEGIKGEL